MNKVTLKITVPEVACPVRMDLPGISLMDAITYELEELCRVQSFERRHGMTLEHALSGAPAPALHVDMNCMNRKEVTPVN
jgi:hypothetical protein